LTALREEMIKPTFWKKAVWAWGIGLLALSLLAMLAGGILPVHDAIGWEGIHRFFSSNMREWHLPFWNKFSQGGTPFYPYYQSLGLIEPLNLGITVVLKILGVPLGYNYVITYLLLILFVTFTSYLVIAHILKDKVMGISFAMIQFLVLLPVYVRQGGVVTAFLYMPSFTLLWVLFLETTNGLRKALLLIMAAAILGFATNVYLPSYLAFYSVALAIVSLGFNRDQRGDCFHFMTGRLGRTALIVAGCLLACLAMPMLAQFWDMKYSPELVPTVRLFQHNNNILANIYGTDLVGDAFSIRRAVSTTLFTMLGIVFEPLRFAGLNERYSEVILYIGCIPLACAVYALKTVRQTYVRVFSVMAAVLILTSCNLGFAIFSPESAIQKLIYLLFPLAKTVEIFQHFGVAATFCLTILAAVGFKEAVKNNDSAPFVLGLNLLVVKSFVSLYPVSFQIQRLAVFIGDFGYLGACAGLAVGILIALALFDRLIFFVNKNFFRSQPVYHALYLLKYAVPVLLIIFVTRNILTVSYERFVSVNFVCACLFLAPAYLEFRTVKEKSEVSDMPFFAGNSRILLIAVVAAITADLLLFNFVTLRNMGYFLFAVPGGLEQVCHLFILGLYAYSLFGLKEMEKKKYFYYLFLAGHAILASFFISSYAITQQPGLFGEIVARLGAMTLPAACALTFIALYSLASVSGKYLTKMSLLLSVSSIFLLSFVTGIDLYLLLYGHSAPILLFGGSFLIVLFLAYWSVKGHFTSADFPRVGRRGKTVILAAILLTPVCWAILSRPLLHKWGPRFLGERYFDWMASNGLVNDVPYKTVLYRVPFESNYPTDFGSFWGLDTFKKEKTLYAYVAAKDLWNVCICGGTKYRINKSLDVWELYKNDFSRPVYVAKVAPDFTKMDLAKKDVVCLNDFMKSYQASLNMLLWDSFYMTRYYYDFLVKVRLHRQIYAGGIINPIADFFPVAKTIIAADKYEATAILNGLPDSSAGDTLVIEKNVNSGRFDAKLSDFFDLSKRYVFAPGDIEKYVSNLQLARKPFPGFIQIAQDDVDRVVFQIDAPHDGFLYYSDGYSKYWSAKLDGQPVEIRKANIAFKAVRVPRGKHVVEFNYSYGLMTAAFYFFLAGCCFFLFISVRLCMVAGVQPEGRNLAG